MPMFGDTFVVSTGGGSCAAGIWWVETRNTAKHSTKHRAHPPHQKQNLPQLKWSIMPKSRKPAFQEVLMMLLLVNYMHHLAVPESDHLFSYVSVPETLDEMKI